MGTNNEERRTEPVTTFFAPDAQVPVMTVALWIESYTMSCARAALTVARTRAARCRRYILEVVE